MIHQLPESASLEHLRTQAKALLRALRAHEPDAISRVSKLGLEEPYRLAGAQLAVAREYGFDSWAKLKRHVVGFADRRDAFFAAIQAGDHDRARSFIAEDPSLVRSLNPHSFGSTPVTVASRREDRKMIDLLLENGAEIDAKSDWWAGGFGPLDFASDGISEYLLSRGATLTAHAAARLGLLNELRQLIDANPEVVRERGGDGQFPLHFAKTPEIVDILLDAGAEIDARDIDHEGTALQTRITVTPVALRLRERGASLDVFSATALGEASVLAVLLDRDPEALERRTCDPGNPSVPRAPGGHIYEYTLGKVQLHQVATNLGQDEVYGLLWQRSSPALRLAMAAWRGDGEAARTVIRDDQSIVDRLTPADMQMLPAAAWAHRTETVRLLLELGFDPNVRGDEESTATDRAAYHGFDDVIEEILPYNPDLTLRNVYGGTPLGACLYGSLYNPRKAGDYARSVELLLQAGSELPSEPFGSPEARAVLERHMRLRRG